MRNVLSVAMESELGTLLVDCHKGTVMRIPLTEMGHKEPPTPVITDRATRDRFFNENIHQRLSRARAICVGF